MSGWRGCRGLAPSVREQRHSALHARLEMITERQRRSSRAAGLGLARTVMATSDAATRLRGEQACPDPILAASPNR